MCVEQVVDRFDAVSGFAGNGGGHQQIFLQALILALLRSFQVVLENECLV